MAKTGVSIAVMPFRNLSPEHDTDYFSNGFVEDLTADLTRFSSHRVLAAESDLRLANRSDRLTMQHPNGTWISC